MAKYATSSTWDDAAEIALLRCISLYRPLGLDRHFHMVCLLNALDAMSGNSDSRDLLPCHVWDKLGEYYNLEGLNEQEEASDDDTEPRWLRNYEKNKELLQSNEAARTRVLEGLDEEEFTLHPKIMFESLVEPRRLEEQAADHVIQKDATCVVPSTSEDDLSDDDPDPATGSHKSSDRDTRPSFASSTRRMTRKRQHEEEDATPGVKDGVATVPTRAGKRRRNAKNEADSSDTLTRPITTRRQQRQAEERESVDEEVKSGGVSSTTEEGASSTPRASRGASARRQSSSAGRNQNVSGSSHASPSPASRAARPRRL